MYFESNIMLLPRVCVDQSAAISRASFYNLRNSFLQLPTAY